MGIQFNSKTLNASSFWRFIVIGFYIITFLLILKNAVALISTHGPWRIADWLINYEGGFVRRGLTGQILLWLFHLSGVNINILVVILQTILYLVLSINTCSMSLKNPFNPITAALVFSPAFILFPVLDPVGGFRKEIMFLAILSLIGNRLMSDTYKIPKHVPTIIGIVCVFMVFSHEMLAAFLPYLVCAFLIYSKTMNNDVWKMTFLIVPAIISAFFIILFARGNAQIIQDICTSLGSFAPDDCLQPSVVSGAITSLGQSITDGHAWNIASNPPIVILTYVVSAFLGFAPILLAFYFSSFTQMLGDKTFRLGFISCVLLILFANLVLLWVWTDLGRFIYVHVSCLSILALMIPQKDFSLGSFSRYAQVAFWLICLAFVTSWRLVYYHSTPDVAFWLYNMLKSMQG